jgi:hypothetical protein
MSISGQTPAFLTRHIRNLRGGSQPILAQASDGLLYVVKFANNIQGANLPFNESMGSELYRACGLAGPSWKPLLITDSFLDQNQNCWMQTPEGRLRPDSGLCFGSRFLGGDGIRLLEILPGTSFKRIRNQVSFWLAWLVDICAEHTDNRQAIFVEDSARGLEAHFVDHGHLFGGPKGEQSLRFKASRYLDPRIYPHVSSQEVAQVQKTAHLLDVEQLRRQMLRLPDDWKTESAFSKFETCLCRLSNSKLVQNIVETMIEAQQQYNEREKRTRPTGWNATATVLCPGIQARGIGRGLVANRASHVACAQR